MVKKRGIPKEVIEELDIKTKSKKEPHIVKVVMEHHQARLTIPKQIRLDMGLKQSQEFEVTYDKSKKEIRYKIK